MLFSAVVAFVILAVLIRLMLRRTGQNGTAYVWLACGLVLAGGMISSALVYRVSIQEQTADRRSLEARIADLTARSLAPGSALGCLDAVASTLVETCERPLFASPEAVAAAVEYVDARFSLLASSAVLAGRDPSYQPMLERLRRGLETDRYGLVAHVLMTRGCNGADCAELRLLRDPARVVANMQARAFETSLGAHALAWQSNGSSPALASGTPPAPQPPSATGASSAAAGGPGPTAQSGLAAATAGSAKFDFPSASSIPAVSIMTPEPGLPPPAAEPRPTTPAPKRAAPPARRHGAREAAAPPPPPPPPAAPAPPLQVAPEAAPEPAPQPRSDPHSTH